MTSDEIETMNLARASLARQRGALARRIGASEAAAPSAAEDLTRILLAIEAMEKKLSEISDPRRSVWPAILLLSISVRDSTSDLKSTARVERLSARRSE